jgi:hypothetical protein
MGTHHCLPACSFQANLISTFPEKKRKLRLILTTCFYPHKKSSSAAKLLEISLKGGRYASGFQ